MAEKKKKDTEPTPEQLQALEPQRPRMQARFEDEIRPKLVERFGLTNRMAQPELEKIVINVNMGRYLDGTKVPANIRSSALDTLTKITGQKPVMVHARKSVSNFKVREGYETAAKVTIRRDRMWHFLDRLINLAAPRIKDFRGLPTKGFDRQGTYSFGLNEQGVFPEIDMAAGPFSHGMNINLVFGRSTPELSRFVLDELGFPFQKPEQKHRKAS
mgnify:CR=1 FL=1